MKSEGLGSRLQRLRRDRDFTIAEVARRLGVSTSTYREWENGRAIRGEPYVKLRDLYQVSLETLLTGKDADHGQIFREIEAIDLHVKNLRSEVLKLV